MNPQIVLASTSPFRKRLMERLEAPFKAAKPACDEELLKTAFTGPDTELCAHLAREKAVSLKKDFPGALIIGSDQSLFCENQVLGKGKNFKGAFNQLKFCSGKTAKLVTSVYICDSNKKENQNTNKDSDICFENITELQFKNLSDQEITNYLKTDEPYGCAGSFKFESKGSFLFEKISCEDPSAIEGLPMMKLVTVLKEKGFSFSFL